MAGERADILFKAELDASGAITSLQAFKGEAGVASQQAGGAFGMLAGQWQKMVATVAASVTLGAAVNLLENLGEKAIEAEQASAKLDAVLKATSYAAGLTASQIGVMAHAMSMVGDVTEEEVKNAAAMLATFKEVRGEGFGETIKVARDLAAVMGTELAEATRLLGKVQQDPVTGMMMMRRAGIVLTDAEKDLVKTTTELSGTQAGQAKILELVKSRVEGVADAMNRTLGGQLKIAKTQWHEITESIGEFLVAAVGAGGKLEALNAFLKEMRGDTARSLFQEEVAGLNVAQLEQYVQMYKTHIESLREENDTLKKMSPEWVKNANAIAQTGYKLAAVTAELKQKTLAENAANEAAKHSKDLTEEQKKALGGLLDKIDPLSKALREYTENQKLVTAALAVHEITQKDANEIMQASADAVAKARQEMGTFLPVMQQFGEKWDWVRGIVENFTQKLPAATSFTGQMWDWVRDVKTMPTEPFKGLGDEASQVFGTAFKDGFLAVMEGKDLTDPMKLLFGGLAGMFAQMLGDQLQSVMSTGKIDKEALKKAGVLTAEGTLAPGTAAMMLGGLLGSIGAAQGNRGLAAFGGAVSGAGAGFMLGGGAAWAAGTTAGSAASGAAAGSAFPVWGTIIGAVVGAALAYFGSQGPSKESAQLGLRGGRGYVTEITGGVNKEAEALIAQQITDRYQSAVMGLRGVLRLLDADITKVPSITLTLDEKSKNIQSAIDAFIKGTVPKAVLSAYKPALEGALTAIGVGAARIKEELGAFDSASFDQALAAFARWVGALMDLSDTAKLLVKTPEELRAEVNRTMREGFLAGIDDVLKQAGEMADETSQLFSKEQVLNAEQLIALGKQQYSDTLNYISQLETASKNIGQLVSGVLLGFEEKRAATGGPESLGAFYQRQLEALQARLAGATSAEQVTEIMAQMAKFGQALADLGLSGMFGGGAGTPWGEAAVGTQEWVEQYLKAQQAVGDALIAEWEKEAADRNALLADMLDKQRAALAAATDAAGSLADGLTGAAGGLDDLNGAAEDLAATLRDVREQLAGLAGAWSTAGEGGEAPPGGRYM